MFSQVFCVSWHIACVYMALSWRVFIKRQHGRLGLYPPSLKTVPNKLWRLYDDVWIEAGSALAHLAGQQKVCIKAFRSERPRTGTR